MAARPYGQLGDLLDRIVRLQRPGESAYLVLLTDGVFVGDVPSPQDLIVLYRAILEQLKGPLRVDFLLIGADQMVRDTGFQGTVSQVVEAQGVRNALLTTFNGSPDDGRHDVVNAGELADAIKDIIVRTASADRASLEHLLKRHSDSIEIVAPLSVSKIVTVSTGTDRARLARARADGLGLHDSLAFSPTMGNNDTAAGWANVVLSGEVRQILLDPAWQAGSARVLAFDGDPRDTLVLLETRASLRLFFANREGAEIAADASGTVTLASGAPVRLYAEVLDLAGDRLAPVAMTRLGSGASLRLFDQTATASRDLPTEIDGARDTAFATFPTDSQRTGKVDGRLTVDGLQAAAAPLRYRVVPGKAGLSLRFSPDGTCGDCDGQLIRRRSSSTIPIAWSDTSI